MKNILKISGFLAIAAIFGLIGAELIRRAPDLLGAMRAKPATTTPTVTTTMTTRALTKEEAVQAREDALRRWEADDPLVGMGTIRTIHGGRQDVKGGRGKATFDLRLKVHDRRPTHYYWSALILDSNKDIVWQHDCIENILTTRGVYPIRPSIADEVSLAPGRYTFESWLNVIPAVSAGTPTSLQKEFHNKRRIEITE